jgi:hypothetical protein
MERPRHSLDLCPGEALCFARTSFEIDQKIQDQFGIAAESEVRAHSGRAGRKAAVLWNCIPYNDSEQPLAADGTLFRGNGSRR